MKIMSSHLACSMCIYALPKYIRNQSESNKNNSQIHRFLSALRTGHEQWIEALGENGQLKHTKNYYIAGRLVLLI